jgi:hypothetical protein
MAVGTLETIMSSSGSSEDGKSKKKKSAMELAEEIRGRAAGKTAPDASAEASPGVDQAEPAPSTNGRKGIARKKSTVFASALMESARLNQTTVDATSPRSSANTLLSEPSLPQTSTSHLEVRTEPEHRQSDVKDVYAVLGGTTVEPAGRKAINLAAPPPEEASQETLLGGLKGWMPTWSFPPALGPSPASAAGDKHPSFAEGSLRNLLQSGNGRGKGKALDRSS